MFFSSVILGSVVSDGIIFVQLGFKVQSFGGLVTKNEKGDW